MPCATKFQPLKSCWVNRSEAVSPSNTTGSDQGWLLRLKRGSIDVALDSVAEWARRAHHALAPMPEGAANQ